MSYRFKETWCGFGQKIIKEQLYRHRDDARKYSRSVFENDINAIEWREKILTQGYIQFNVLDGKGKLIHQLKQL